MAEEKRLSAWEIVEKMMNKDAFSKWLGVELVVIEEGYAKIKLTVRDEMLNGFGIAHGGITYSLADSALAFAGNSHGQRAVSTNTTITHFVEVKAGDVLTAATVEHNKGERIAHYLVNITNQNDENVAALSGSIFRTSKLWLHEEEKKEETDL
ncbi:hotdog fold thioesterase [Cryomorpha ignava]|uniref:Hotdog fold thioesterase n=1 Tax=Cryomorpha ignava TaxID=101383 RepID=A0A7K3WTN5_9FLAO|nr:hotdog fold thioesterase [Cryomorpha ignava]NEN24836.1 hotdog fold thioesterase [Cryomorpha ignava]